MVVIAIGCRWMMDDAIGVLVAERIRKNLNDHGINVVLVETDFEFGMDALDCQDCIIILDALYSGKRPGDITVIPLQEICLVNTCPLSQHESSLLDYTQRLSEIAGCLVGIEVAKIDYGLELSAQLRLLFADICNNVERIILN